MTAHGILVYHSDMNFPLIFIKCHDISHVIPESAHTSAERGLSPPKHDILPEVQRGNKDQEVGGLSRVVRTKGNF